MDAVAKIPIGDLTLEEAYNQVEDPSYWSETMPVVLFHFSIGDYWQLRVSEHAALLDFLTERGLYASP
jgi:hypothetical protein